MQTELSTTILPYRMIHDLYVLLDDGDQRVFRAFDLSTSQYAVLVLLDNEQGKRLTDLSAQLLFDKSTITRIVDRLEQSELVRRIADPDDRRAQRVVLTPTGAIRRARAQAAHLESVEQRLAVLDELEHDQLVALLAKLRVGLRVHLADGG
ncbi:MAG: MarR family transcriptional regulator [Chloroflexaceae bacterium]|nr:MarR family transcriptional regulator [Chloroflexaceae bacterium]